MMRADQETEPTPRWIKSCIGMWIFSGIILIILGGPPPAHVLTFIFWFGVGSLYNSVKNEPPVDRKRMIILSVGFILFPIALTVSLLLGGAFAAIAGGITVILGVLGTLVIHKHRRPY